MLDQTDGLTDMTVSHPIHTEQFSDASIAGDVVTGGGVMRSGHADKVNEIKPQRAWAERSRAAVLAIANADVTFVDLLEASIPTPDMPPIAATGSEEINEFTGQVPA